MLNRLFILFSLSVLLLAAGCNEFGKIQKSTDLNYKFTKDMEYYNKEEYVKSQMLFDELFTVMRNTDKGEDVLYFLAYSNYHMGDYILAGYQFKLFFRNYPLSSRAEECLYMSALCHYNVSPAYSLDQYDTYTAIEQFQYFIQMFPNSNRVKECNKMIDLLHEKLQKKHFEIAKLYLNIGDYKAAITSFDLLLKEYPDTKYREESMFLMIKARYFLAENSVEAKKEQRIKDTIDQYNTFAKQFPESEYTDEAKDFRDKALKLQEELEKDKKSKNQ